MSTVQSTDLAARAFFQGYMHKAAEEEVEEEVSILEKLKSAGAGAVDKTKDAVSKLRSAGAGAVDNTKDAVSEYGASVGGGAALGAAAGGAGSLALNAVKKEDPNYRRALIAALLSGAAGGAIGGAAQNYKAGKESDRLKRQYAATGGYNKGSQPGLSPQNN